MVVWLLHTANPNLIAGRQLELRGVIAMQERLAADEWEEWGTKWMSAALACMPPCGWMYGTTRQHANNAHLLGWQQCCSRVVARRNVNPLRQSASPYAAACL